MKLKDWALVVPLMMRAFVTTFRSGRKFLKIDPDMDPAARKIEEKDIAVRWAETILRELHVKAEIAGATPLEIPCIFVGNHSSYLDVIVLSLFHPVQFVAKAEIRKWPVIGKASAKAGTIFVKRESQGSKRQVAQAIREGIVRDGKQIAVFPEGTTSLAGGTWRRGIFKVAHELQIPVQAFTITYEPARRAAYIGKDHFFTHMIKLIGSGGAKARIEFAEPKLIKNLEEDVDQLENWMRSQLWENLRKQGIDPTTGTSST